MQNTISENTHNFKADGLKQQKTSLGATFVSKEPETEATL